MATAIILFASIANAQSNTNIKKVLDAYIQLKDALVKSDGASSSSASQTLLTSIQEVNMNELNTETHTQWMKVVNELKEAAEHISETKEIAGQRDYFMSLSKNLYAVIKVSKSETPIYYQFCPMANSDKGAIWLSSNEKIMNPYFGAAMLSCGTIQKIVE